MAVESIKHGLKQFVARRITHPTDLGYEGRVIRGSIKGASITAPYLRPIGMWTGYEPHVSEKIDYYLKPGQVAYDIGAHVGRLALVASKRVGSDGHVYAFEPGEKNLILLKRNIENNPFASNITVVEKAVAANPGYVNFATFDSFSYVNHVVTGNEPPDAKKVLTSSTSIDHFVFEEKGNRPPNLIKIDVEGYEGEVFRGAYRVFDKIRPVVIAETRRDLYPDIKDQMEGLGYKGTFLHGGISDWEHTGLADILWVPDTSRRSFYSTSPLRAS